MTVRRTVAALQASRSSLQALEAELEALLSAVRDRAGTLDACAPERLRAATLRAQAAVASLGNGDGLHAGTRRRSPSRR